MSEPINICPTCYAPFTKGEASIKTSDDVAIHYWYHLLETKTLPKLTGLSTSDIQRVASRAAKKATI